MPRTFSQPLRLVEPRISASTVRELEKLLGAARAGEIVGLAYVAFAPKNYSVNAVGQARQRRALARGAIGDLWDLLGDIGRPYK